MTDAAEILATILRDGADIHRCAAAQALRHFPSSAAADALRAGLLDEDADVRFDVVESLAALGTAPFADALMENLRGDPDPKVKQAVLTALIGIGYPPVLPILRALVTSRAEDLGLVWDDADFFQDGWDDWLDIQLLAISGLGRMRDAAGVDAICTALNDDTGQDVSETAIPALLAVGPAGIDALKSELDRLPPRFRRRVAEGLGDCAEAVADDLALACLADPDPDVRQCAVRATISRRRGTDWLAASLQDDDAETRALALRALGADVPKLVVESLTDRSVEVRQAAGKVIAAHPGRFSDPGVAQALDAGFAIGSNISASAARAWMAIDQPRALERICATIARTELKPELRLALSQVVAEMGQGAVDLLSPSIGDEDRSVRNGVMAILGEIAAGTGAAPENHAAYLLLKAARGEVLPDPAADLAAQVAEGTDADTRVPDTTENASEPETESPTAKPGSTLDAILRPVPPDLSVLPGPGPAPELDPEDALRLGRIEARRIGKKRLALDPGIPAHVEIRGYAVRLLGGVAAPWVVDLLVQMLTNSDAGLRRAALDGLINLGELGCDLPPDAIVAQIGAMFDGGTEQERIVALRLAGWLTHPDLPAAVAARLEDPSLAVRLEAVRTLARIDPANPAVAAAILDSWPAVRLSAARAVTDVQGAAAYDTLFAFAFHEEGYYHREAASLLAEVCPERAIAGFIAVLNDQSRRRAWQVSIEALAEIPSRVAALDSAEKRLA